MTVSAHLVWTRSAEVSSEPGVRAGSLCADARGGTLAGSRRGRPRDLRWRAAIVTGNARPDVKVSRLARDRMSLASEILARAFHDDPVTAYMIPDPYERARRLPVLYAAAAGLAERFGEGFVTDPELLGAALWFSPGRTESSRHTLQRSERAIWRSVFPTEPSSASPP